MSEVTIDLVTERPDGRFAMILVEQGPWTGDRDKHLRMLQDRLYDYVDVAIDGHLAKRFPESSGRGIVIRIDAYETPAALRNGLSRYFDFYNTRRRHTSLGRRTPDAVYFGQDAAHVAA